MDALTQNVIYIAPICAIIGLIMMMIKSSWVKKQSAGNEKMQEISKAIQEGALAFLNAEYRLLLIFVVIASVALFGISIFVSTTSWMIVPAFIFGAIFSALAGNIGMRIATASILEQLKLQERVFLKRLKFLFLEGRLWVLA